MNIGRLEPDNKELSQKSGGYLHDIPRLILLVLMLMGAICGGYFNNYSNQPLKVIGRSMKNVRDKQFRASMESSTSIGDSVIGEFKSRQRYIPGSGLATPSGSPLKVEGIERDSHAVLHILDHITFITEHDKQDMYGNPTRHFTGSYKLPDDGDSTVHAFEYWINMRSLLPVRLIMTTVVRNAAVDDEDELISRITYTNIGYSDWMK